MSNDQRTLPYMDEPIIPSEYGAGFAIGMSFSEAIAAISRKDSALMRGPAGENRENRYYLDEKKDWIVEFSERRNDSLNESCRKYITFRDDNLILYFGVDDILYLMLIGKGFSEKFAGVGVGDIIDMGSSDYELEFDSGDEMFYFTVDGDILPGVSIVTDEMQYFDLAPLQTVNFLTVHNWSLARMT